MHKFKEVYEEEKSIDAKIKMMDDLKKEMKALDEETNQMMNKLLGDENQSKENETKDEEVKTEENQDGVKTEVSDQESDNDLKNKNKQQSCH